MINSKFSGVLFCCGQLYLAIVLQITLVSNNYYRQRRTALLSELLNPGCHFGEGVDVRNVVDYECTLRSSVVNIIETVVLLLTSCVPNGKLVGIHFDSLGMTRISYFDSLLQTSCIHRTLLLVVECLLGKANGQRSFADPRYQIINTLRTYLLQAPLS